MPQSTRADCGMAPCWCPPPLAALVHRRRHPVDLSMRDCLSELHFLRRTADIFAVHHAHRHADRRAADPNPELLPDTVRYGRGPCRAWCGSASIRAGRCRSTRRSRRVLGARPVGQSVQRSQRASLRPLICGKEACRLLGIVPAPVIEFRRGRVSVPSSLLHVL